MDVYESIEYKDYTIDIVQDECGENPIVEHDGNVEFCCWHSRYDLGNSDRFGNQSGSAEECRDYAKTTNSIIYSLFMYEHSGIVLSLGREYPFNCPWDSGQLGYILIDREWLKEFFDKKYFTKKIKAKMREVAEGNVKLYNDYLSGSVYGYQIKDQGGEDIDSCFGFYGYEHRESGLLEYAENAIDCTIEQNKKDHFSILKKWILNKVPLQYREPLTV